MARFTGQNASITFNGEPLKGSFSFSVDNMLDKAVANWGSDIWHEFEHGVVGVNYTKKEHTVKPIRMKWLTKAQLSEPMVGLVFLFENRGAIFGKHVTDDIAAILVHGELPEEIIANYESGLLVRGFDESSYDHPAANTVLKIKVHKRGTVEAGNPRTVYEFLDDGEYGLGMYAGLTVHDVCGSWSSWPVHEYEVLALTSPTATYPDFSEQFAVMTEPKYGWLLQSISSVTGECGARAYKDGDIITVPLGAHPSVAMPGSRLAYFWAYKGAAKKDF